MRRLVRGAFAWWRTAVTGVLRGIGSASSRFTTRQAITHSIRAWFRPAVVAELEPDDVPTAMALPILLLVASTAAGGMLGLRHGGASWAYAAELITWSAARLAVLLVLAPTAGIARTQVAVAWATALPAFVLSAIPGLGLVAFALSATVAYQALVAIGATRRDTVGLVTWAYGGHAVAAGLSALAGAVLAT